jgi:hypothetical protein
MLNLFVGTRFTLNLWFWQELACINQPWVMFLYNRSGVQSTILGSKVACEQFQSYVPQLRDKVYKAMWYTAGQKLTPF